MAMNDHIAKKGSMILVESGAYSDYGVDGLFLVLLDFSPKLELAEYMRTVVAPPPIPNALCADGLYREDGFRHEAYIAHLIGKKLIREVEYDSLYVGGFGDGADAVEFTASSSTG